MKEENNIFDLDDLSDVPSSLAEKLSNGLFSKVLYLFSLKSGRPLNISQLIVGFYRVYGREKTRMQMTGICYRMYKSGLLKKTKKRGEYVLNSPKKED